VTKGPFCHGSLHDAGLKVCLYIKAATLPLRHLAIFRPRSAAIVVAVSSSAAAAVILPDRLSRRSPILCPTVFSAAAGLPKSVDALAPRHAAGPPPSAPGTRAASFPTCPGAPPPPRHPPPLRRPPRPPGLHHRRASRTLPPGRPELRRLVLLVRAPHSCPPQLR
jgi:hypothetical protein